MKKIISILSLGSVFAFGSCDLDRFPETDMADTNFWQTESDLKGACNELYSLLAFNKNQSSGNKDQKDNDNRYWYDNRADDIWTGSNDVSNGHRTVPNTSNDWSQPYIRIQMANIILEKAADMNLTEEVKNRYFAEARFFRAYYYFKLLKTYGEVPLITKAFKEITDPDLLKGRDSREDVLTQIYDDLDFAIQWLPSRAKLTAKDYGRATSGSAQALKARIGLYEGTRCKFHNYGDANKHLQIAVIASEACMAQGYSLYPDYYKLFLEDGQGAGNKEGVWIKVYGKTSDGANIQTHNNSRQLENTYAPTRNLIDMYLCADGLPYGKSPLVSKDEQSFNEVLENRDPRLGMTVYKVGEPAYKGIFQAYAFGRTAYNFKKGYSQTDWDSNGGAVIDKMLIRYAEVLLNYAEAKYELNGSISDDDLEKTINVIRHRAGFEVKLTNAFVTANGLDMRGEIRRERSVELAGEGFRYDDLIRWKTAETVLPKAIMGARFTLSKATYLDANGNEKEMDEWNPEIESTLPLDADKRLVMEEAKFRTFNPQRDYLYPVPLNEISLSNGNVKQNPNWE